MATQSSRPNQQQSQRSQGEESGQGSQMERRRSGFPAALTPTEFLRMNPFSLMGRMVQEMDRLFSESGGGEERERTWVPTVEVSQREGSYVVRAELPGLKPEDVKLEITDDAVVIQGERKFEHDETKGGVHVTERRYGRFYRAIPLPEGAKTEDAKAKFENGVLEVTVPVEEQRNKRREITIESGSSQPSSQPAGSSSQTGTNKAA